MLNYFIMLYQIQPSLHNYSVTGSPPHPTHAPLPPISHLPRTTSTSSSPAHHTHLLLSGTPHSPLPSATSSFPSRHTHLYPAPLPPPRRATLTSSPVRHAHLILPGATLTSFSPARHAHLHPRPMEGASSVSTSPFHRRTEAAPSPQVARQRMLP